MDRFKNLWDKVVSHVTDNKEAYIRVGLTVAGAIIGAAVTAVVSNIQNDAFLMEEVITSIEDNDLA